jgi:hypothetical protein
MYERQADKMRFLILAVANMKTNAHSPDDGGSKHL